MATGRRVSGAWVRGAARAFERAGLCAEDVCTRAGLEYADAIDPTHHLSELEMARLWESAVALSDDPLFGLHAGEHVCPRENHILALLAVSGRTLGDGLSSLIKYQSIITTPEIGAIRDDRPGKSLVLAPVMSSGGAPHQHEFMIAALQNLIGTMTLHRAKALKVDFLHRFRGGLDDYTRVFECEVFFEQPVTSMSFDDETWDMKLEVWDPFLRSRLEHLAIELKSQVEHPGFIGSAASALEELLAEGASDLASVAKRLRISDRTFQRRLHEEGTNFRELLDATRRSIATKARDRLNDEDEIAELVGFGSVRALRRAFHRWDDAGDQSDSPKSS